jgi:hypothetical protein
MHYFSMLNLMSIYYFLVFGYSYNFFIKINKAIVIDDGLEKIRLF